MGVLLHTLWPYTNPIGRANAPTNKEGSTMSMTETQIESGQPVTLDAIATD